MASKHQSNLDFEHAYHQYNWVQNDDPTNEYMYQMPIMNNKGGNKGDIDDDTNLTYQSQPIDLLALNHRLQVLGLNAHSSQSLLLHQPSNPPAGALGSAFKTNPISPLDPLSPPETSRSQGRHLDNYQPSEYQFSPPLKPPTAIDLGPSDSLSQMYRPYRGPVESVRSHSHRTKGTRRGGTNIDPVDEGLEYGEEYDNEHNSSWETRHPAPSDAPELLDEMTMGRTEWATTAGDMLDMRDRLINHNQAQQAHEVAVINQQIADASSLAAALTKLEVTQDQLRSLQATLIAERVARTQMERRSTEGEDDVRDVKNELAGAVRALRRAKEEAKRNEEEKRRLAKCFEETKVQLYKYHEELRVRDARSKGREEGRAEAWQEAERWMGQSPPIPVDPIHSVPSAVLRQTPMDLHNSLPQKQTQSDGQQQPQQQYQQQHPSDNPNLALMPHVLSLPSMPPQQSLHGGSVPPPQQQQAPQQYQQSPPQHQQQYQAVGASGQPIMMMPPIPQMPGAPSGGTQTIYQPMVIPITIPQQQPQQHQPPFQPYPAQPPHTQNIPRSAPHRLNQLPSQSHQPQRAATVIDRTPQNPYPPQLPQQHQRSATLGSLRPANPGSVPRHHAAGSYLDRIDHDPHLQQMLHGTNAKTVHTSAFSDKPPTSRSVSAPLDKPLPTPNARNQTQTQSRSGTLASSKPNKHQQRYSLLEGLHERRNESALSGDDRYPAFPHQKTHHSRNASFDSVNPAGIALPHSTAGSAMNTPRTKVSQRSKVAGALRGGTEIEDLSDIAEEEREAARRSQFANLPPQLRDQHHMQSQHHQSQDGFNRLPPPQQRQQSGYAPSMPPMRGRPIPKMPQVLGGGTKAPSEPQTKHHGFSNFFHRSPHPAQQQPQQQQGDDRFAEPHSDKPMRTHDLYVPPELASQAVHSSIRDIQGPRTSALGLEGLDDQAQHRYASSVVGGGRQRSRSGTMESGKAPTIMIQPPSSQSKSRTATTPIPKSDAHPLPLKPKTPNTKPKTLTPSHQQGPTKRQTTIVTEYYDAHAIPLPPSKSHAPTIYEGFSPDRLTLSPPDMIGSDNMIGVNVIDYALKQALPDSRPTTIHSILPTQKVTVASEPDVDEPTPRFRRNAPGPKRKPTLTIYGHNHVDPRSVPLPASRAPTQRPRTSTYAGTVATIEEVTEEESARGNKGKHGK